MIQDAEKLRTDLYALQLERTKSAGLELGIEHAEQMLDRANADLMAYRDRCTTLAAVAKRVEVAESSAATLATQLQTAQSRNESLLACLVWARDRDKQWRGVSVDEVNRKLDEVIRG